MDESYIFDITCALKKQTVQIEKNNEIMTEIAESLRVIADSKKPETSRPERRS